MIWAVAPLLAVALLTTVAAMAGSLVGAFAGAGAIPPALLAKLENGPAKGRTHIQDLADRLYTQFERIRGRLNRTSEGAAENQEPSD
ncbi:hypothetical protein GobsT_56790 [Gemmata obscuriglobus]|uniref:Uncharacterized protein n=1 Tax=Gemmata obscuriglobus TaxID=114 RepID=A0A2Z3GWQ7_9BACT|nr:ADP-ribosylglycohydrolase family protein [Gemmata obscuriglobus]AWM36512.1 hypothetical protein C1280_05390 [Gemmata obscuriglobus]QEG30861.1 hypothetical protein GobsT_56790 [Gemmata obscuriglobus]VTS08111.1 unnamed protein product [Gemmata obscuriglobus UQM 2246]VTS10194.1 unnamed protein product [Gemmata obscuriglobus UQM 2246]